MRKVAFLVGNDTFPKDPSIPPLRFTQNDARDLAEVLEDSETCGFETRLYLNRPSQEVLTGLDQISGELGQDDTLLFYYSGHGKLRGNELCLVSNETVTTILGATSIRTRLVLEYLQGSLARRRILILDCCHSGAIGSIYKAVDSKSALDGLANSFGSYILTASTAIQWAEEREKEGHGIFTMALIDCLRDGGKESVTVNDWYEYAYSRLKAVGSQTPLKWGLQEQGPSFEIGNFKAKHERLRREQEEQLISTAKVKLNALVASGVLTETHIATAMRLLESDKTTLFPYEKERRDKLKRYLKGDLDLFDAFGNFPVAQILPEILATDQAESNREGASGSGEPKKPKSYSHSATLLIAATLSLTVLIVVGAAFKEQVKRFLFQPSITVSTPGGVATVTPGMTPTVSIPGGVPAATPDMTPGLPAMSTVLTAEDFGFLKAYPRLLTYLLERTDHGGRCSRLKLYVEIAKNYFESAKNVDRLASSQSYSLADDKIYLVSAIAQAIKRTDIDLYGMLEAQRLGSENERVVQLYARLVLGHENDPNYYNIMKVLSLAGFRVDPDPCREG